MIDESKLRRRLDELYGERSQALANLNAILGKVDEIEALLASVRESPSPVLQVVSGEPEEKPVE